MCRFVPVAKPNTRVVVHERSHGIRIRGQPRAAARAGDLYRHVNAEWLAANPVPAEYGRWGTFEILNDDALIKTRTLMEELGPEDKAGAWMVSGMNAASQDSHAALAPTLAIAKQLSEASVRNRSPDRDP